MHCVKHVFVKQLNNKPQVFEQTDLINHNIIINANITPTLELLSPESLVQYTPSTLGWVGGKMYFSLQTDSLLLHLKLA